MTNLTTGQKVTGTFSCLPFTGIVLAPVSWAGECYRVQVDAPYARNLPVYQGVLNFHPNDNNITIVAAE